MKRALLFLLLLSPVLALAQSTRQISGQVLDQTNGQPLAGATVFIDPSQTFAKNYTPQGAVADMNGKFTFRLPVSVKLVVFSYIGYESLVLNIDGKNDLTVRLTPDNRNIDAVVVTGYQKIEKRKLTSSISTVDMGAIRQVGAVSVAQMLEGQLAGVFSTPTHGAPGAANSVKVRSTATLNGSIEPLWVLDGIPLEGNDIPKDWSAKDNVDNLYNVSIAGLNPDDIESINVLKDAAATAIYGARAANGVIVVTTKRGKLEQPTRVNASLAVFVSSEPNLDKLNLMNASQKVDLELSLAANGRIDNQKNLGGVARLLDKYNVRKQFVAGGFSALPANVQQEINNLRTDGTDWASEIYRPTINQQYSLSVSGGGQRATYYFSTGYYTEQGTTNGTGFDRLNLTLKTDYQLLKNLKFGVSMFYNQNKNKSYLTDRNAFINPANYTRSVNPYIVSHNPDNTYAYDQDVLNDPGSASVLAFNYLEEMENTRQQLKVDSYKAIFDLEYKPIDGLRLYTLFGLQKDNSKNEKEADKNSYYTRFYASKSTVDKVVYLPDGGVIQNWNGDMGQYTWKAQAEYAKRFAQKHEIDFMGGIEMRGTKNTMVHTKGFGYDSRTLVTTPIMFPNTPEGESRSKNEYFKPYIKTFSEQRYLSYFATGSYTYDNRYTFFGSMRYDGTNLFGVDQRYRFNPIWSVSGSWSINREEFLRDIKWLDLLKLRASYGVQGNIDRTTSPYVIGTWGKSAVNGLTEDVISVSMPPNPNLRWESTYSWNAAVDFAALDNRINFTAEVYGRRSENLITSKMLPTETGFVSTSTNYGEISSRGIELTLNTLNVRTKDFRWETTLTFANNKDEVKKVLDDDTQWMPSKLGYSSSSVFGYKTAGLDERGMPMFWKDGNVVSLEEFVNFKVNKIEDPLWGDSYVATMNNDQKSVKGSMSYLGSRDPKFTGGFINRFNYKNFDLTVSCNFVFKQLVTETPFYDPIAMNPGRNYSTRMNQVWSPSNPGGIYPAITGMNQADGSSWGGRENWTNYDDLRVLYYVLDEYGGASNVNIFENMDIWSKEMSYLRINSIRLGYTLPAKISQKLRMKSLRVSVEARNPFVIATNYDGYFDPETYGNIYAQPLARTFSFGLNIGF